MMKNSIFFMPVTLAMLLCLSACQREPENKTVGQKLDQSIADAQQTTQDVTQKVSKEIGSAADTLDSKAAEVKGLANDSAISALVNAELAKDASLKILRIDVDTQNANVTLSGKAPDEASKLRAAVLAKNVSGVKNVSNNLEVGG